ncbi:MAG: GerMN domain-containing protein [Acidobacteria bacterium]|nr:GerMN domain-containing protein [Acidobacteriota bacterium]
MTAVRRGDPPDDARAGTAAAESQNGQARAVVRISRTHLWAAGLAGATVLALGVWLVTAKLPALLHRSAASGAPAAEAPVSSHDGRRILATLYYVADDGYGLVATRGTALYGATPEEQARQIVVAQVQAPPSGQRSAIPDGTTVRTVFLTQDGRAYVDLGGAIRTGHTGGSFDEALAAYAIVNALTVNLPSVTAVQILIDGQQVDTLAGHLDLRYPLSKALEWVRKGP